MAWCDCDAEPERHIRTLTCDAWAISLDTARVPSVVGRRFRTAVQERTHAQARLIHSVPDPTDHCDGSMTCGCPTCRQQIADRIRRGPIGNADPFRRAA